MVEGYMKKLVDYIKKNLAKGYTIEALKWALVSQGYSRTEVDKAIKITNEELAKKAPKIKEKPIIKFKREPVIEPETKPEKKSFWKKLQEFFES